MKPPNVVGLLIALLIGFALGVGSAADCVIVPPPTSTAAPTNTPTPTITPTLRLFYTNTATLTNTPSPTHTLTATPTLTPTNTPTNTATSTNTATYTHTPSPTATATNTPTNTATLTNTLTPTKTPSGTPTNTATPTITLTPSATISTPTREVSTWTLTPTNTSVAIDCASLSIADGYGLVSANPCLHNPLLDARGFTHPAQLTTVYRVNAASEYNRVPTVGYNLGYVWDITGFAGQVGYRIGVAELQRGQCYTLKLVVDADLIYEYPMQAEFAFYATAFVYDDTGGIDEQDKRSVLPGRNVYLWPLLFEQDNPVVSIEAVFNATWPIALAGSHVTITELGLFAVAEDYCE